VAQAHPHRLGRLSGLEPGRHAQDQRRRRAFASPVNGDKLFLTPEMSMQIQTVLNSDIVMQFDECTPYDTQGHITTEAEARHSMELSLRWAGRCISRV
jgi:tRNA-guanine family transglycosylase